MLDSLLNFLNPRRKTDMMYATVLSNLTRAAAPRRSVDDLYAEFVVSADRAIKAMS